MDRDDEIWIAFHEAGHAVRAAAWGFEIESISIEPTTDDPVFGTTVGGVIRRVRPLDDCSPDDLLAEICISTAGEIAEQYARSHGPSGEEWPLSAYEEALILRGARGDHRRIATCFARLPHEYQEGLTWVQINNVDDWIPRPEVWHAIRQVARALLKYHTVSGLRLASVLCQGLSGVRAPEEESRMNNVRRLEINARRAESIHRRAAARQVGASAASSAGTGPRRSYASSSG
jgi:hypothetical protein